MGLLVEDGPLVVEVKVACCGNVWDNFVFTGAGQTAVGKGVVL